MFLIDKPFVSDFLIETIKDNNYKIIATKAAKELVKRFFGMDSRRGSHRVTKKNPEFLFIAIQRTH
jgi:hypothetical protein